MLHFHITVTHSFIVEMFLSCVVLRALIGNSTISHMHFTVWPSSDVFGI